MATTAGKVELGLNTQATVRMLVVAFVVGGAVATALFAALVNKFHLGTPYPKDISMNGPYWGLFFKFGLGIAVACFVIVKLRQPRGARIEWSAWGITEWDGDAVRCAIELTKVKVGTMLTRMKARGASNVAAQAVLQRGSLDGAIGSALTLGDDDGRRIYAGEGTQLAWLNDRLSSVSDIAELRQVLADRPSMAPDIGRSAENRLVGVWLLAIIAYITALLAGMSVVFGNTGDPILLIMLAAAVLFGTLRALIPRLRAFYLVRAARHLSEPVSLLENQGPILIVRTTAGPELKLDTSGWKHPDAGLALRRGEAWLAKSQDDLETAATRKARQSRVLALRLESWSRLLLPLAALALLGSELRSFENWKTVAAGGEAPVKSVFVESNLVRESPAGLEMIYSNGKRVTKLKGAAEVLAAGPDGTVAFQTGGVLKLRKLSYSDDGWDMNAKQGANQTSLPRARFVSANKELALIITDAGEGQLWKTVSIDIILLAKLARPLANATAAAWGDETLFVGMADGSVELFALTGEAQGVLPGKAGPVRSLATQWNTLAVAHSAGVTIWDVRAKGILAEVAQKDVATIAFGSYPDLMHQQRGALLILSAAGVMTAVETDGVVRRKFDMHLPQWEHPVGVSSNPREVLVSTDRGGLYQLWIH